jgi:predicted ester cyclase
MNNQLTGLAVVGAVMAAGLADAAAAAAVALSVPSGQALGTSDKRLSERAKKLIGIGETAIAKRDDGALDAFFAPDFVFHGLSGDATYPQLKAAFADYRASFHDFRVTRQAIVENGAFVSARTTMSGTFTHTFDTPFGPIAPTGKRATWELINVFRYDADGRLAEEWVQYDYAGFMRQLGVELVAQKTAE